MFKELNSVLVNKSSFIYNSWYVCYIDIFNIGGPKGGYYVAEEYFPPSAISM